MQKSKNKYNKTLLACYLGFVVQAICANFVPLLYIVFHDNYNISFGQLALISTTFFFTQLIVDYICGRVVDKIGYRPSIVFGDNLLRGIITSCSTAGYNAVAFYRYTYLCHDICYR